MVAAIATAPLTMGLILELTRNIGRESEQLKRGEPWQSTLGVEIEGKTLGIVGLGKLGSKVAKLAQAFGMNVIAWSPNLTPERCEEAGVGYATREELFATADIVSIHVLLSQRTRGLYRSRRSRAHEAVEPISSTPRAGRSSTKPRCWKRCAERRSRARRSTSSRSNRCRWIIRFARSTIRADAASRLRHAREPYAILRPMVEGIDGWLKGQPVQWLAMNRTGSSVVARVLA